MSSSKKSVEQTYVKLGHREQIFKRPGMYIGSVDAEKTNMWIYNAGKIVEKEMQYIPGLYKIYDEILVNAHDEAKKNPKHCDKIKITITENEISVYNNSRGIDVEFHKEHNIYVPELIFGNLLTSSNYDDNEKRITGGMNGYGAKLTNIFSNEFQVEIIDEKRGKYYKQTFKKNMTITEQPIIEKTKESGYVKITFCPDFKRFGIEKLSKDMIALFVKRAIDISAVLPDVKVSCNGEKLPSGFKEYIKLYEAELIAYEKGDEYWEYAFCLNENKSATISLVNGINTYMNGTHVNYITEQITKAIKEKILKKNKEAKTNNITKKIILDNAMIFINCSIINPSFSSQVKEKLDTPVDKFGSKCVVSKKFISKVLNSKIIEYIMNILEAKDFAALQKKGGKKKQDIYSISKYRPAKYAGKCPEKCQLIITEGLSAGSLALASVDNLQYHGILPIKGKFLNVMAASVKKIAGNDEVSNLVKVLGLEFGKTYTNISDLRYGSIMIFTDQDSDGFHIKGLLMNFIYKFWPSLMKLNYVQSLETPLVKIFKSNEIVQQFFNIDDYNTWKSSVDNINKFDVKYYKGLGTSTDKEGKEYFIESYRKKHQITYYADKSTSEQMKLAFDEDYTDERKDWILARMKIGELKVKEMNRTFGDFIQSELICYNIDNVHRSIASVIDGLKSSQRKILYSAFDKIKTKEMKVSQFAAFVASHSSYHHGEDSLVKATINMAQNFVGANNLHLLKPIGQFGTRDKGGKDHAAQRYIFTKLKPYTMHLFNENDSDILHYLDDDGYLIEPVYYVPILPYVLINGTEGIGTGFRSDVQSYKLSDIINNIIRLMLGEPMQEMHPWFNGFDGEIIELGNGKYDVQGCFEYKDNFQEIIITELPIGTWTEKYIKYLIELRDKKLIKKYHNYSSTKNIEIEITLTEDGMAKCKDKKDVIKLLKLSKKINTNNMYLHNEFGNIKKYSSPLEIIQTFYNVRLHYYSVRKLNILLQLQKKIDMISEKIRYIEMVINNTIVVFKRKKTLVIEDLEKYKFKKFTTNNNEPSFDYLTKLYLFDCTEDEINKLKKQLADLQSTFITTIGTTEKQMWYNDIMSFIDCYQNV